MWFCVGDFIPSSRDGIRANQSELSISLAEEIGSEVGQWPRWANWTKSWLDLLGKRNSFLGVTSLGLLSFTAVT